MPKGLPKSTVPLPYSFLMPFLSGEMDTGGGSSTGFTPVAPSGASGGLLATEQQQQQLQLLMLLQHNIAAQQQAQQQAAAAAAVAAVEPLSVLSSRGYKRKLSSIDGLPPSLEGTPLDDGSPGFWSVTQGGGVGGGILTPNGGQTRRNKTFSSEMSDLFVHEVINRKETLVENNTNREVDFNRQKKHAWQEVYDAVRSVFPSFNCTVEGMKTHWRYRKRRVRDAAPYMKRFRENGVGGETLGDRMNDADWAIYDILNTTGCTTASNGSWQGKGDTSDLEEKDIPTPPAKFARFDKLEDLKCEDSNSAPFPVSPASVLADGDFSNPGVAPPTSFSAAAAAAHLLLGAASLPVRGGADRGAVSQCSPSVITRTARPATLQDLMGGGNDENNEEERRLRKELITQQTKFFVSMNQLVADVRTQLPSLLAHLAANTPLASPANSSSSSGSIDP
ncbi:hypothetical protein PMAYCL1PPCAC_18895 [Pristionchus mayeri]|uniref:Regulatory protein zeste n=1 Tax=Pristionchus mayeri TaxID=1317129 RepID=A0AAN5CQS1_9BILA|nr:hypothetical protein PMAYCL1PPCAC_18895 [Pristionchus mayeri]